MQNDLISRSAMKRYIDCGHLRPPTEVCFSERDVIHILDKQPAVDAEPVVHGRWIPVWKHLFKVKHFKCSVCGHREKEGGCAYCHCGAKMDGGFC